MIKNCSIYLVLAEDLGVLREAQPGEEHVDGGESPAATAVVRGRVPVDALWRLIIFLVCLIKLAVPGASDAESRNRDIEESLSSG